MALAAARMGIWQWSVADNIVQWSPEVEAMFGVTANSIPKHFEAYLELVHPSDRFELQRCVGEALLDPSGRYDIEHRALRGDGSEFWVQCTGLVQRSPSGDAERIIGTVADITDRKSLEGQLRQAQKMESIGELAGGLAHDFNNLLTVVLGEAQSIRLTNELEPKLAERLGNIEDAARRGRQLTRQLLVFARQQALQLTSIKTSEFLAELAPILRRLAGENVATTLEIEANIGAVRADPSQLEQVFMNLVVNAKEAMAGKGELRIRAENVDATTEPEIARDGSVARQCIRISVADTGTGIDPVFVDKLFEPFFTTKPDGTGLGLATCYGIVRQCGGRIRVENRPDGGAQFHVLLPLDGSPDVAAPTAVASANKPMSRHVLLVESDETVRQIAVNALETAGFVVAAAADAEQATLIAENQPVDLIVTDFVVPGVDGVTMAHQLRDRIAGVKVLFITSHRDESTKMTGDERRYVLPKPFTPADLAQKARAVLDDEPQARP